MKNHYELMECLGAGRFAQTYKAKVLKEELKCDYGEFVAIKIPLDLALEIILVRDIMLNENLKSRFLGMKSPNIVSYLGFDDYWDADDDRHTVVIMEYCDGGNLRKKIGEIESQDPMDFQEAVNIMIQISEGLKVVHQCRLIHGDICPENILFCGPDNNQTVKLADFGVSTILLSIECGGSYTDKWYYLSPELIKGEGRFYSDIYSLGVVFYEMTTGQLPFIGKSPFETMELILNQDPVPPSTINPEIDPVLENIILKMIKRDYTQRPQTAKDLHQVLTRYSQGIDPIDEELRNS
jgi:eukaryotic-like serine/threonine-protein kinase